jgi:hypothetical protein
MPDFGVLAPPQGIPPEVFRNHHPLDALVLSLAMACNDLKDCAWVAYQVRKGKRKHPERNGYDAALSGTELWTLRVSAGILHETLKAIEQHRDVLQDTEASSVVQSMPARDRRLWNEVFSRAVGSMRDKDRAYLVDVRNNLAYHYYQPGRLATGYAEAFLDSSTRTPYTEHAWFSYGDRLSEMRFYFVDAAVQFAHQKIHGQESQHRISRLSKIVSDGVLVFVLGFIQKRLDELGIGR